MDVIATGGASGAQQWDFHPTVHLVLKSEGEAIQAPTLQAWDTGRTSRERLRNATNAILTAPWRWPPSPPIRDRGSRPGCEPSENSHEATN